MMSLLSRNLLVMSLLFILFAPWIPSSTLNAAFLTDAPIPEVSIASANPAEFEIGDDFQISFTMPQGDQEFVALWPAVAYNSTDKEFLVVWPGVHNIVGEYEIWGSSWML